MGYEYIIKVPEEYRARVAEEVKAGMPGLWEQLDSNAGDHINITGAPEGLFICDYLSSKITAALAFRVAIEWLLRFSPQVLVEDA